MSSVFASSYRWGVLQVLVGVLGVCGSASGLAQVATEVAAVPLDVAAASAEPNRVVAVEVSGSPTIPPQGAVVPVANSALTTASAWPPTDRHRVIGSATSALLSMQASGMYGSHRHYPMTVDVAEKVYERYVNSFTHAIPEKSDSSLELKGSN